jgi:putative ABC transport system permease protein
VVARVMQTLLHDVTPHDPATLAGVAAVLTVVAALASLIPAWRATRVDPVTALKAE